MKNIYFILLFITLILTSCGKSKQDLEIEKAKIELENQQQKIHEQKIEVGKQKKKSELTEILEKAKKGLVEVEKNLEKVKQFKFGRSQSTKNEQLNSALNLKLEASRYVKNIQNEIAELELIRVFNFQKTPDGVVKYLFASAKNKDFSKLRYLCDPYAENDGDTKRLCNVEMYTNKYKEEFIREFQNGRIIGEPKIEGDIAKVEFAFGRSSNKLETMNLIKRNGNWYLGSF